MWFLGEDEQSQEKICYYLRFNCMHDNWLLRGDVHIELYKIWKKCNSIIKKSSTNKEISFTNYTFVSIHWTQFGFSILEFLMSFQSRTCQKRHFYQNFFYLKMVKKYNFRSFIRHYHIISILRALCQLQRYIGLLQSKCIVHFAQEWWLRSWWWGGGGEK